MSLVVLSVNKNSFCLLLIITSEKIKEKTLQEKIYRIRLFLDENCLQKITMKSQYNSTLNLNFLYIHGVKGECTNPMKS